MRYRYLICGLILTGCAATPDIGTKQLSPDQFYSSVAKSYISVFPDVSQAEAARRMRIMGGSQSVHSCARQQPGFAGAIIVHTPEFEVRSYFKGDAEQLLAACTDDPNFRAIKTEFSLADLERDKRVAEIALRDAGIEPLVLVVPYGTDGHQAGPSEEHFTTTDGHVLVSVLADEVTRAETILAPLALQTVYVREAFDHEDIILTSTLGAP